MAREASEALILSQQLLLSVAEELKLPLLQITRQAEQAQLTGQTDFKTLGPPVLKMQRTGHLVDSGD